VRETRFSWVFLTEGFAYKLKKPAVTRYFDHRTAAERRATCEAEVRLNQRLAAGIYLGLLPLVQVRGGQLQLGGDGRPVDWLVRMRRLPEARLLDAAIRRGTLRRAEIEAVADRLASFYAAAVPVSLDAQEYLQRFADEQVENHRMLHDGAFRLEDADVQAVLAAVDAIICNDGDMLRARLHAGRIVEGHGDLRPEHVYLADPPAVIDCLEFSRRLRLLDPFEELAYLGMECAVLGAAWVGPLLIERCVARLSDPVPDRLIAFYVAFRAAMRARQSVAHLRDHPVRQPEKWLPLAQRYLAVGVEAAAKLRTPDECDAPTGTQY